MVLTHNWSIAPFFDLMSLGTAFMASSAILGPRIDGAKLRTPAMYCESCRKISHNASRWWLAGGIIPFHALIMDFSPGVRSTLKPDLQRPVWCSHSCEDRLGQNGCRLRWAGACVQGYPGWSSVRIAAPIRISCVAIGRGVDPAG